MPAARRRDERLRLLVWLAGAVVLLAAAAPLLGSFWVYLLFQPVCHQRFERAIWLAGAPMAVCARCLGVYAGAFAGLLFRLPARRGAFLAAVLLLAADMVTGALGWRPAWAAGRLLTGLLAGATAAALVAHFASGRSAPSALPAAVSPGARASMSA